MRGIYPPKALLEEMTKCHGMISPGHTALCNKPQKRSDLLKLTLILAEKELKARANGFGFLKLITLY
jgi:hypothetical protein